MARLYQQPPSRLAGIEDPYAAYCLDEAIADYIGRVDKKQKLRPEKKDNNRELIAAMGGEKRD
jgi:hypothetical protein